MNKPIHPAVAEHVMEENERLRDALRRIADSADKHVEQGAQPDLITVAHWVGVASSAISQQAEPLYVTHRPLIRNAINLLGMRRPVAPDVQRVIDDMEAMLGGQSTPAGAPSEEWLQVATLAEPAPAQDERDAFKRALHSQSAFKLSSATINAAEWAWFARPAQTEQQPVAEPVPVGWLRFDDDQRAIFTRSKRGRDAQPLYAHPTAYRVSATYAAQPIRLPELRDADHPNDHALRAYEHGWNCAIAEVQRLNADPIAQTAPQHFDDRAIDRFAVAMKTKMAAARAKARDGWFDRIKCPEKRLARMLVEHLSKGNEGTFEDVANFCMMPHQRGEDPQVLADAAEAPIKKALGEALELGVRALESNTEQPEQSGLVEALEYYANGDHLLLADPDEWDTCSGEPTNFLHDEAGTASVEDGSIAKVALEAYRTALSAQSNT